MNRDIDHHDLEKDVDSKIYKEIEKMVEDFSQWEKSVTEEYINTYGEGIIVVTYLDKKDNINISPFISINFYEFWKEDYKDDIIIINAVKYGN